MTRRDRLLLIITIVANLVSAATGIPVTVGALPLPFLTF